MTATAWSLQTHWDAPWEAHSNGQGEDSTTREGRFEAFLEELLPVVQRRHPGYTDERILETAIHLAAFRLQSEAMNGSADRRGHGAHGAGGKASSDTTS